MRVCRRKGKPTRKDQHSDLGYFTSGQKRRLRTFHCIRNFYWKKICRKRRRNARFKYAGQAEKLQFLLHTLIRSSRLENGIITLYPKKQGVRKMVEAAVLQIRPKAQQRGIRIEVGAGRKDRQPEERQLEERQLEDRQLEDRQAVFDEKWTAGGALQSFGQRSEIYGSETGSRCVGQNTSCFCGSM